MSHNFTIDSTDRFMIRSVRSDELSALIELEETIFGELGTAEEPEVIATRFEVLPQGIYVVEDRVGGTLVGYCSAEKWASERIPNQNEDTRALHNSGGNVLCITSMAVRNEVQNQNLGSKPLSQLLELAEIQGCTSVILKTANAEKFYADSGFSTIETHPESGVLFHTMRCDIPR